jgi:quercetin dioxygenase-like cupin family protein
MIKQFRRCVNNSMKEGIFLKKTLIFSENQMEWQKHPQFPGVFVKPVLKGDEGYGFRTSFIKVVPGGEILPHTHDVTEVFYFYKGKALVLANGENIEVSAGDLIIAPAGEEHGTKNLSDEDVYLLANFEA